MIPKKTDRNSESLAFLLISCTVIVQVGNEQKTKRYTTNKNKGTNKPVKIEKLLFFFMVYTLLNLIVPFRYSSVTFQAGLVKPWF